MVCVAKTANEWCVQDLRQKLIEVQHREKAAKEETEIYKKQLFEVSQTQLLQVVQTLVVGNLSLTGNLMG